MDLGLVVAVSENNVIGNNGDIPWHIPADMKLFKQITTGNTVIMGRRTYESLPDSYRPLPNRNNIVVSTTLSTTDDFQACSSYDDALAASIGYGTDVFIIGGQSLYEKSMPDVDVMYISHVHGEFEGDTFFPEFNIEDWKVDNFERFKDFDHVVYRRKERPGKLDRLIEELN